MKKSILFLVVASMLSGLKAIADDVTFTMHFNSIEGVSLEVNYQPVEVSESVEITTAMYNYVTVKTTLPTAIQSITMNDATVGYQGLTSWGFTVMPNMDGNTVEVQTYNFSESQTASLTINVDDPSAVSVIMAGTNSIVDLVEGENTVKFNPDVQYALTVSPVDYEQPIYGVTKNGTSESISVSGGSYSVNDLEDHDVIDIQVAFPDADYTVKFNYDEGAEGAVNAVYVDEELVELTDNSFTAKAGSNIAISFSTLYNIVSVAVNGTPVTTYGSYSFVLNQDTQIDVVAHKYAQISFTVNIDDPSTINFYKTYSREAVTLNAGDNTIEVPENNAYVAWEVKPGCFISSVTQTLNGETTDIAGTTAYPQEGMTISFVTGHIQMDETAVIWVDDISAADYYSSFVSSDRNVYVSPLRSGYTEVAFDAAMNFTLGFAGSDVPVGKVYLNGEEQAPQYEGGTTWAFSELPDNSVIKLFLATDPVQYTVIVEKTHDATANIVRDILVEETDDTFTCFNGTLVRVYDIPENVRVSVNDVELTPVNGEISFNVEADTLITLDGSSAIENINVENGQSEKAIFDLFGRRVNGTPAPGVYVVDGVKTVIR